MTCFKFRTCKALVFDGFICNVDESFVERRRSQDRPLPWPLRGRDATGVFFQDEALWKQQRKVRGHEEEHDREYNLTMFTNRNLGER